MMTMARPALKAVPTSRLSNAVSTVWPNPGVPTSAASVAIDSAAIEVWLIPTTIVDRDIGSSTLVSRCARVEPRLSAASIVSCGTSRMPCMVNRTTGGMA